ncbi:MAG TPA: acyltransferase [Xanthobacteraceae bacterium]|jgi:peptidoglycan/LPS O-acetylase OafA/YrhL
MAKLLSLQATRAVAANLVVLSHLFVVEAKYTAGSVLPAFAWYGTAGVDVFFVLSGFIMVAAAGRKVGPLQFLWRRAARIYPAYWLVSLAVLAATLVAPTMVNASIEGPISIWRSFLLVPGRTLPLLAVGWTLIHEAYFYVVFATFLALRIPVVAGLIGWGLLLLGVVAAAPNQVATSPILLVVTSPLTAEFMMGAVVGVVWLNRRMPGSVVLGAIGGASLIFAIVYLGPTLSLSSSPHFNTWRVLIFGIPSALALYALAAAEHRSPAPQPPKLLAAMGDWSYATYLTHVLVISAIGRALALLAPTGGRAASLMLIVTGLVAANLAGAGVYVLFERPVLHWLRQLGSSLRLPVESGYSVDASTRST